MGGSIAFEMAQQLQQAGETVGLLVLIDSFASLFSGEQAPPAAEEASRLAALFHQDLLRATGHAPADVEPELLENLRRVFESNLHAAWNYSPRPYAGSLVSFEASESSREHGWERLVSGGVEVHRLAGDHYSILRDPGVGALAAGLSACLERAPAPSW